MFQGVFRSVRRTTVRAIVGGALVVGTVEVTTHLPTQGRSSHLYHTLCDDWVVPAMRYLLDAETAHTVALTMAVLAPTYRPSAKEQKLDVTVQLWEEQEGQRKNVVFSNPIGLAAGYDKDGVAIRPMLQMGFGFVEIGSVCLRPQPGNPSPRMWRLVEDRGIINQYGFNSQGAEVVSQHLKEYRQSLRPLHGEGEDQSPPPSLWQRIYDMLWPGRIESLSKGVVGVNLGKNKTSTTHIEDYQSLIEQLGPYADYFVINVSSPNTPGLRDLQATESLETLLVGCQEACRKLSGPNNPPPPLLVKLSPDLSDDELIDIAAVLLKLAIDGIVLTNTTTSRPANLMSPQKGHTGGLSGKPLAVRSTECIRLLYHATNGRIPIIGSGGVYNGHDAYEKFKAGASLVEVYSGMVYEGPGIVSKIRDELADIMIQNGQRSLQRDVIGLDHEVLFWNKQRKAIDQRNKKVTTIILDQLDDHNKDKGGSVGKAT